MTTEFNAVRAAMRALHEHVTRTLSHAPHHVREVEFQLSLFDRSGDVQFAIDAIRLYSRMWAKNDAIVQETCNRVIAQYA